MTCFHLGTPSSSYICVMGDNVTDPRLPSIVIATTVRLIRFDVNAKLIREHEVASRVLEVRGAINAMCQALTS
jgi:hypothetical protein